jgi:hypothetical protein
MNMTKYVFAHLFFMSLQGVPPPIEEVLQKYVIDYSIAEQFAQQNVGDKICYVDATDDRRIQMRSLAQQSDDLDNSACGYYSIFNGLLHALAQIRPDRRQECLDKSLNREFAQQVFGTTQAPWRLFIKKDRAKEVAREHLRRAFLNQFKGIQAVGANQRQNNDFFGWTLEDGTPSYLRFALPQGATEDEFALLKGFLSNAVSALMERSYHNENSIHFGRLSKQRLSGLLDGVIDSATQEKRDLKNKLTREAALVGISDAERGTKLTQLQKEQRTLAIFESLRSAGRYDLYFEDFDCEITSTLDGVIKQQEQERERKLYEVTQQGSLEGRWILGEEVMKLVNYVKLDAERGGIFGAVPPNLLVTTYGDLGGDFAGPGFDDLYRIMRDARDTNIIAVVSVYVQFPASGLFNFLGQIFSWIWGKKEESFGEEHNRHQQEQDGGHYISLVVSRIRGQVQYIISDSLGNANRLRDPRVNRIINILDGKEPLSRFQDVQVVQDVAPHVNPDGSVQSRPPARIGAQVIVNPEERNQSQRQSNGALEMTAGAKFIMTGAFAALVYGGYKYYYRNAQPQARPDGIIEAQPQAQLAIDQSFIVAAY